MIRKSITCLAKFFSHLFGINIDKEALSEEIIVFKKIEKYEEYLKKHNHIYSVLKWKYEAMKFELK